MSYYPKLYSIIAGKTFSFNIQSLYLAIIAKDSMVVHIIFYLTF